MSEVQTEKIPSETARQILSYLCEHPNAQDTVAGIAEWWLLERQVKESVSKVAQAIEDLRRLGFLITAPAISGPERHRLNRSKLGEIERALGNYEGTGE